MATAEQTAKNAAEIAKRALQEAIVGKYRQNDYGMLGPGFAGKAGADIATNLAKRYYDYQKGNIGKIADWINSEDAQNTTPPVNAPVMAMSSRLPRPPVVPSAEVQTQAPAQQALVGETIYQDRNGNQIAKPAREVGFMDRPGAFTGPNNDPNSPGMNPAPAIEETLLPFNPDDARFAKRNLEIAAQQGRHKAAIENEAAAREAERFRTEQADRALARKQQEEDRAINMEIQRKNQEYIADQRAREAEIAKANLEFVQRYGLQPTPENQKAVFDIENRQSNINEYVGNHQYLSRLESQIPVIFESLASGQKIDGIPPEVQSFIDQAAPQLDSIPKDQRGAVLRDIQNQLMSQVKSAKEIAAVKLQQANKQNFPARGSAGILDQAAGFLGQ